MPLSRRLNRLSVLLLLLLSVLPLTALIRESFFLRCSAPIALWSLAFCLLLFLAAAKPRAMPFCLLAAALLLAVVCRLYSSDLNKELNDLVWHIGGVYTEHYAEPHKPYLPAAEGPDHSSFLLLIALLLSAHLTLSLTASENRVLFSLLGCLPTLFSCLAVNGKPSVLTMLCLALFLALLPVGGRRYDAQGNRGQAILLCLLPLLLLLTLLFYRADPEGYELSSEAVRRSRRYDWVGLRLESWLGGGESGGESSLPVLAPVSQTGEALGSLGDSEELDLGQSMEGVDLRELLFRARSDRGGTLYLRRRSYGDYLGRSWAPGERYEGLSALSYLPAALEEAGASSGTLSLRAMSAEALRLTPYYADADYPDDVSAPAGRDRSYSLAYYAAPADYSALRLPDTLTQAELQYRVWAHARYTALPDETRRAALALAGEAGLGADSPALIDEVARYVQSVGSYDLETPPCEGEDVALSFLTETKRGYCIHYASAAAVLYRSLGLPARVVDGYLLRARAGVWAELRRADQHAWVEVYVDGLGWLPVEVTGSAGEDESPPAVGTSEQQPGESAAPEVSSAPATPKPSLSPGLIESLPDEGPDDFSLPGWLLPLLGGLASPLLLWLLTRALWKRRLRQKNTRRAAVSLYHLAGRAEKLGVQTPKSVQTTAEQASFSRRPPTREQLQGALRDWRRALKARASEAPSPIRLLLALFYKNL